MESPSPPFDCVTWINRAFVLIILLIGAVAVYEDIHRGKISNRWIKVGLKIGAVLYLILLLLSVRGWLGKGIFGHLFLYYPPDHYGQIATNIILNILVAYLFWQYRFWSAGDAKLFILFASLLPLEYYTNGLLPWFPSSALLINIFLPVFAFLSVKIILHSLKATGRKMDTKKISDFHPGNCLSWIKACIQGNLPSRKEVFVFTSAVFLTLIALPLLKGKIRSLLPSPFQSNLSVLMICYIFNYYFYEYINKFLRKSLFWGLCVFGVIFYVIFANLYSWETLLLSLRITFKAGFAFMIILIAFKGLADAYIKEQEITLLDVDNLKPGIVLPEEIIKKIKKDKDFLAQIGDIFSDGLTQKQVNILKNSLLEEGTKCLPAYKTSPFAHWILLGVIITIVLKQSLIHFLLNHPGKLATAFF